MKKRPTTPNQRVAQTNPIRKISRSNANQRDFENNTKSPWNISSATSRSNATIEAMSMNKFARVLGASSSDMPPSPPKRKPKRK